MSLTSRKKRPLDRSIPCLRDTKLVIIATEGKHAEKRYFEIFRKKNTRVHINVLETQDCKSAPRYVLKRLKEYKIKYDIQPDDQLWLVIDKDNWEDKHLAEVAQCTKQRCFNMAVSRPCFEVWLYLHYSDPPATMGNMTGSQIKNELRNLLGSYNEKNFQLELFEPKIDNALTRAEKLDNQSASARWPTQLGTHVYKLVTAINTLLSL